MKTITFRLKPGADLKQSIEEKVSEHAVRGGFIVTCVGGLEQAVVRMAGAKPDLQDIRTYKGDYEITSLVGTVSVNGVHLHMSFSDNEGVAHGGHLKEGTIIHPTAEIVLGFEEGVSYTREFDSDTGFPELVVSNA
jgi:uncharacterized protein